MNDPWSRFSMLGFIAILTLVGMAIAPVAAQDDPPIAPIELAPGVTAEIFAAAPSVRAEGQTVYLARFVFEPDAEIFPHGHPGTTVLGVESGSFGWTLMEGTAHVVRGAGTGSTDVEDLTEPGVEVVLEPGDAIYYDDDVVHIARGAGDEPAVVMGTLILTSGEDLIMPADMEMDMAASPAPQHPTPGFRPSNKPLSLHKGGGVG